MEALRHTSTDREMGGGPVTAKASDEDYIRWIIQHGSAEQLLRCHSRGQDGTCSAQCATCSGRARRGDHTLTMIPAGTPRDVVGAGWHTDLP